MPKWLPHRCKVCGRDRADGWRISRRGLCDECGDARMAAAMRGQAVAVDRITQARRAEVADAGPLNTPRGAGGVRVPKPNGGKGPGPSAAVDGKPTRPAA